MASLGLGVSSRRCIRLRHTARSGLGLGPQPGGFSSPLRFRSGVTQAGVGLGAPFDACVNLQRGSSLGAFRLGGGFWRRGLFLASLKKHILGS